MEVKVSVQVPTDYTQTEFTLVEASTLVEIEVKRASNLPIGCDTTQFDDISLPDMTVNVHG